LGSILIPIASAGMNHGLLMVGSFLGTLISIERAMVMKRNTWLFIPFLTGTSILPFLLGFTDLGLILLITGSLGLGIIMHIETLKHPEFHSAMLYAGAASWFIGNLLAFQTGLIAAGSTWWIGFLLFTLLESALNSVNSCPFQLGPN
jgi:hypothetical protein